jgi:acetyl-CoA acetyltransferase
MSARIAIVGYAQTKQVRVAEQAEVALVQEVVISALKHAGLHREAVGFTVSGSCDYLSGGTFTFVANLDAVGAWPPIHESHVEMDGAWALYEAWVRLQHGDVDTALVFGSGKSSTGDLNAVLPLQMDPYYLATLGADPLTLAALQARAVLDAGDATEQDFAETASRSRKSAESNPYAQVQGSPDASELLKGAYVRNPLRRSDLPPITDGAVAVVLATEEKALELAAAGGFTPAWITGIDHRIEPHYPGVRDLTKSPSTTKAAEVAGLASGPIDVAELSASFSHQEGILARALGFGSDVEINPSGGALAANPIMATGLIRFAEAAKQIRENGRHRVLAHATSGPLLQQNLVAILEGDTEGQTR